MGKFIIIVPNYFLCSGIRRNQTMEWAQSVPVKHHTHINPAFCKKTKVKPIKTQPEVKDGAKGRTHNSNLINLLPKSRDKSIMLIIYDKC